jgi:hypothetical protein
VLGRCIWLDCAVAEDAPPVARLICMTDPSQESEPTQQTRPKKGEPIEIPVPKKGDVMSFLEKTAKTPDPERAEEEREKS